jgi:hypothetical protein
MIITKFQLRGNNFSYCAPAHPRSLEGTLVELYLYSLYVPSLRGQGKRYPLPVFRNCLRFKFHILSWNDVVKWSIMQSRISEGLKLENWIFSSWKMVTGTRWCVKVSSHCWGVLPSVHCCVRPRHSECNGWRITASYLCLVTSWSNEISDSDFFFFFGKWLHVCWPLEHTDHGLEMLYVCSLDAFGSFNFFVKRNMHLAL